MALIPNLEDSRGNHVDCRTVLGRQKNSTIDAINFQSLSLHDIVLHRGETPHCASNRVSKS